MVVVFVSLASENRMTVAVLVKNNTGPDSKVRGASMGPTWALSSPDWPHVGPMNLALRGLL